MTDRDAHAQSPSAPHRSLSADAVLVGALQAYTPARLGCVTHLCFITDQGGISLVTTIGERKFVLPASDLAVLHAQLGAALAAHRRKTAREVQPSQVSDAPTINTPGGRRNVHDPVPQREIEGPAP